MGSQSFREMSLFKPKQSSHPHMPANKDGAVEEEDDEDDLKQVIKILNDQVLKKSSEISEIKKQHNKEKTDLEI